MHSGLWPKHCKSLSIESNEFGETGSYKRKLDYRAGYLSFRVSSSGPRNGS